MNRRNFLGLAGRVGAGAAMASLPLVNCSKSPAGPDDTPKSVPVTLQFDIYNHTQGRLGSFTKSNVMSGTSYSLTSSSLISDFGIRNVDPSRLALRRDNLGSRVAYSRLGTVTYEVPGKDTNFDIFLFNNAGAIFLYDWHDALNERWGSDGSLMYSSRQFRFYRKDFDGMVGEERVWGGELLPETSNYGVFDQLNNLLAPSWATFVYGHFERLPTGTSGHSSYGFGSGYGREYWKSTHEYVVVNPTLLTTIPRQVAGGFAAIIETLIGWENIGDEPSYTRIQDNGVLNQVGKDYITYLFARNP